MESTDTLNTMDVDTMLWYAGDFSKYQYLLMFLFSIVNVLSAFHYFGQTFISLVPDHECKLTPIENATGMIATSCSKISTNGTIYPCNSGWIYTNTYGFTSIVQELNWVCDDAWKPTLGQSVFFVGSVLGSLGFGVLADHIGRLNVLILSNMCALVGNLITTLSATVTSFAISRFIAGCATDSNFVMMYIIVMEYVRPSMRTFGLNLCIGIFYCLGCMIVPWLAIVFGYWKWFLLAVALPHTIILFYYFMVPESAQWLLSKQRTEEAIKCFLRIARVNNKTIDLKILDQLRVYCREQIKTTKHENLWGLLKTPKLRKKTLILTFKSMAMTLGYDAISRNVNGLGYSPYALFSLSSSTIFPACVLILLIQDKVGRKALASSSLLLSGVFSAITGFVLIESNHSVALTVTLAVIARLAINVGFNSGMQYAVELIPTVVRGQGVSAIHVAGYAATFFSAQILYLANYWRPSPELILGALLIVAAIACLFLPETLHRTLPVTLQDGEDFGEDEEIFEFACCIKNKSASRQALAPEQQLRRY